MLIHVVLLWVIAVAGCIACISFGYWMGRNSIGKPFREFPGKKQPPKEKSAVVIEYDPWEEALLDPKLERKNTVE